ncbi:hypothetical protein [Desulfosarcina sp.]|uniref:hypothetical protein n=1 Tax=Desulfosarcina sp. TaxID=2027861 RepID=UPI0039707A80
MRSDWATPTRTPLAITTRLAVAALMLTFAGCMNTYGRFTLDAGVDRAFQTGERQPAYNYFYAGRDNMPYAIIGIDRDYTVPSRYWVPFDPQPDSLRQMSGNIYNEYRTQPYGALILDTDGKAVGVWYSTVYNRSVKVDQHSRTVEVLFKNPENNDRPM